MTQPPQMPSLLYIDRDPDTRRLIERSSIGSQFHISLSQPDTGGISLPRMNQFDVIVIDFPVGDHSMPDPLDLPRHEADFPAIVHLIRCDDAAAALAAPAAGATAILIKDAGGRFIADLPHCCHAAIEKKQAQRVKEKADQDIRESVAKLEQLNAKQAVLLREMNHRIGNSLQLIISMIRMQATATKNTEARQILQQAIERVIAVSQVHQRLYNLDDAQYVQMRPYINQILSDHKIAAEMQNCRLSVDIGNFQLETDRAIALGIIATELVTNAIRHAYPAKGGPIRISLAESGDDFYLLTVADEGIGMGPTFKTTTIGARIVDGMAKRLQSQIVVEPTEIGTKLTLRFPKVATTHEAQGVQ